MKKQLFFAAAATALFCACSNEDAALSQPDQMAQAGYEKIVLGNFSSASAYVTRGAGVIDSLPQMTSSDVYVLMTTISTPAAFDGTGNILTENTWGFTGHNDLGALNGEIFNNLPSNPVADLNETGKWGLDYQINGETAKYYPYKGASDFFGYYVDDAAWDVDNNAAATTPIVKFDSIQKQMTVAVKIDGTQDLMAGKATNADVNDGGTIKREGFSAATARGKGIERKIKRPEIKLQHLLTQFQFAVLPDSTATGMKVTKIEVLDAKTNGTMLVAYDEEGVKETKNLMTWANTVDTLELQSTLPLTVTAAMADSTVSLTGAMMVNAYEKDMKFRISYTTTTGAGSMDRAPEFTVAAPVPTTGFEAGKAYKVTVKLYGEQEIKIDVELADWSAVIELPTVDFDELN